MTKKLKKRRMNKNVNCYKSFAVLSLDEAYTELRKDLGSPSPKPPTMPSQRKRRMSTGGATVKMKPISNEEAIQNLRAGKFHEKALRLSIQDMETCLKGVVHKLGSKVVKKPSKATTKLKKRY